MRLVRNFSLPAPALAAGTLLCALAPTLSLAQNSPWLPIPNSGSVSISDVSQTGDSAYVMGAMEVPIVGITGGGANRYKRETVGLKFSYGVSDSLAVDANIAHGKAKVGAADSSSGFLDSNIGLSWRVLDEYENRGVPSVTVRLAGIIGGNYDGARLAALGKDASGYELSLLVGKQFGTSVSVWGGVNFEKRNRGVPNATAFDLNIGYSPLSALTLSLGYTNKKYDGNLDIAGPGFSPAAFQRVSEERETMRLGASYGFAANQSIALSYGKVLSGRNTVKDDRIVGFGYTLGF